VTRTTCAFFFPRVDGVAELKKKGDLAELKVAADLVARGCQLYIPFGEDSDYDLLADFEGRFHRVQVKYTKSDGRVISVKCSSHSLTGGKIRSTKHYTMTMIDWIAVFDATTDRCYYIPSRVLGTEGRSELLLRLAPARNGQLLRIRRAEDYLDPDFSRDPSVEPAGIEPATSALQTPRSAS
jgi:PD-(D/E)XK endonuclease